MFARRKVVVDLEKTVVAVTGLQRGIVVVVQRCGPVSALAGQRLASIFCESGFSAIP